MAIIKNPITLVIKKSEGGGGGSLPSNCNLEKVTLNEKIDELENSTLEILPYTEGSNGYFMESNISGDNVNLILTSIPVYDIIKEWEDA